LNAQNINKYNNHEWIHIHHCCSIAGCRVDKILVLNKLGLGVVPNSFLSSGWSLHLLSLIVLTDILLAFHLGSQGHPSSIT